MRLWLDRRTKSQDPWGRWAGAANVRSSEKSAGTGPRSLTKLELMLVEVMFRIGSHAVASQRTKHPTQPPASAASQVRELRLGAAEEDC